MSEWLRLIAVLCENKAIPIGRYVATVTREIKGGEVEAVYKETGSGAEMTGSQDDTENAQRATTPVKKKRRKRTKTKTSVPETIPSKSQQPATERTETDSPVGENSFLSEPVEAAGQQQTAVELSHFRSKTERKDGPKRRADSTEIPHRKYCRRASDVKTYRMNDQGQLQCQQDPSDMTRVSNVKELPVSREGPICHEPVGAKVTDMEQLISMFPNSFGRLGSLKGEYTIKIDPTMAPVQEARWKVPIESK